MMVLTSNVHNDTKCITFGIKEFELGYFYNHDNDLCTLDSIRDNKFNS